MGKRAVIYARISQDRDDERAGVDRQLEDCQRRVKERGYELAAEPFVDNNVSAYSGKPRPAYQEMVKLIKSDGVSVIVAYHIDRLYRSPRELEDLIDLVAGKDMIVDAVSSSTIDLSDSDGQAMARIGVAIARKSSDDTRRRVKRSKHEAKTNGRWLGGKPIYGYDFKSDTKDPRTGRPRKIELRVNRHEAKVLREVRDRLLAGESIYAITASLNARGDLNKSGLRWKPSHLARLMVRATIAGMYPDGAQGNWPNILSTDEHYALRELLPWAVDIEGVKHEPSKHATPRLSNRRHPLTGLVRCAACDKSMLGSRESYRCDASNGGCRQTFISTRGLERYVVSNFTERFADVIETATDRSVPGKFTINTEAIRRGTGISYAPHAVVDDKLVPAERLPIASEDQRAELTERIAVKMRKIAEQERILDEEDDADLVGGNRRLKKWREELSSLQAQLGRMSAQTPTTIDVEEVVRAINATNKRWNENALTPEDITWLHSMFADMIERIVVKPKPANEPVGKANYTKRVRIEWKPLVAG